jgi:hypothetical protein
MSAVAAFGLETSDFRKASILWGHVDLSGQPPLGVGRIAGFVRGCHLPVITISHAATTRRSRV